MLSVRADKVETTWRVSATGRSVMRCLMRPKGREVVKKSETVAYKTSRSGAMIMTADELYSMLECAMKATHVESKGDTVAYIAGYMTGDPQFRDRVYDLIHQVENS